MSGKKTKHTVDSTIKAEKNVTTEEKVEAAKAANKKAASAAKKAAKANAEATAAVAKDTAKKTQKAAKEATKKGAEATKETAKKAAKKAGTATKETAGKIKETAGNTKAYNKKPKRKVWIQHLGREVSEDELVERAVAQFVAVGGAIPVKKISLYIKPEEMAAYYVINEQYTGRVDF